MVYAGVVLCGLREQVCQTAWQPAYRALGIGRNRGEALKSMEASLVTTWAGGMSAASGAQVEALFSGETEIMEVPILSLTRYE